MLDGTIMIINNSQTIIMNNNVCSTINADGSMMAVDLSSNSVTSMDFNGNISNSAMTASGLV